MQYVNFMVADVLLNKDYGRRLPCGFACAGHQGFYKITAPNVDVTKLLILKPPYQYLGMNIRILIQAHVFPLPHEMRGWYKSRTINQIYAMFRRLNGRTLRLYCIVYVGRTIFSKYCIHIDF